MSLEIKLKRKLNNARIVAGGNNPSKCAGVVVIDRAFAWIDAAARRNNGVQVADRISEIDVIQDIESFEMKLQRLVFSNHEPLDYGNINIRLTGST